MSSRDVFFRLHSHCVWVCMFLGWFCVFIWCVVFQLFVKFLWNDFIANKNKIKVKQKGARSNEEPKFILIVGNIAHFLEHLRKIYPYTNSTWNDKQIKKPNFKWCLFSNKCMKENIRKYVISDRLANNDRLRRIKAV